MKRNYIKQPSQMYHREISYCSSINIVNYNNHVNIFIKTVFSLKIKDKWMNRRTKGHEEMLIKEQPRLE